MAGRHWKTSAEAERKPPAAGSESEQTGAVLAGTVAASESGVVAASGGVAGSQ